ncbi:MAG: hypothetical protein AB7E23_05210 [Bacilli bacterium]
MKNILNIILSMFTFISLLFVVLVTSYIDDYILRILLNVLLILTAAFTQIASYLEKRHDYSKNTLFIRYLLYFGIPSVLMVFTVVHVVIGS